MEVLHEMEICQHGKKHMYAGKLWVKPHNRIRPIQELRVMKCLNCGIFRIEAFTSGVKAGCFGSSDMPVIMYSYKYDFNKIDLGV